MPFLDSQCGRQGKVQSMERCLAKQGKAIARKIWEVATACPKDGEAWLRSLYLAPLPLVPCHRSGQAALLNRNPTHCGNFRCLTGPRPKTQRKIWLN